MKVSLWHHGHVLVDDTVLTREQATSLRDALTKHHVDRMRDAHYRRGMAEAAAMQELADLKAAARRGGR